MSSVKISIGKFPYYACIFVVVYNIVAFLLNISPYFIAYPDTPIDFLVLGPRAGIYLEVRFPNIPPIYSDVGISFPEMPYTLLYIPLLISIGNIFLKVIFVPLVLFYIFTESFGEQEKIPYSTPLESLKLLILQYVTYEIILYALLMGVFFLAVSIPLLGLIVIILTIATLLTWIYVPLIIFYENKSVIEAIKKSMTLSLGDIKRFLILLLISSAIITLSKTLVSFAFGFLKIIISMVIYIPLALWFILYLTGNYIKAITVEEEKEPEEELPP